MEGEKRFQEQFVVLSNRAVLQLTGPDRVRYLNGQVTNDVSTISEEESKAACVCNLKGKVEFLVWIRSDGESLWIDGQLDQREALLERLDRYLIADDCEFHDRTEDGRLVHHFFSDAEGATTQRCLSTGKDLWVSNDELNPFPPGKELELGEFEASQLQQGIPRAPDEITGAEFPAELGIDSWTVDFHKGCYLGQEVISRIESVGRVKRHLCLVVAKEPFPQNSVLRNVDGKDFLPTRASEEISGEFHLSLAWLKSDTMTRQPVHVQLVADS